MLCLMSLNAFIMCIMMLSSISPIKRPSFCCVYHVAKAFHALCASMTEPAVFQRRVRMADTSPHPSPLPGCSVWVKGALACRSPSDRAQAGGSEIHEGKGSAVCLMQTLSWGKLTPYHSHTHRRPACLAEDYPSRANASPLHHSGSIRPPHTPQRPAVREEG